MINGKVKTFTRLNNVQKYINGIIEINLRVKCKIQIHNQTNLNLFDPIHPSERVFNAAQSRSHKDPQQ